MRIPAFIHRYYNSSDSHFVEVLKGSFWAITVIGVSVIIQFLFDLFIARSYGPVGSGIFYLSFNIIIVIAMLARLGTDQALIRFVSPLHSRLRWAELHGLTSTATRLTLSLGLVGAALLFMFSPVIAQSIFQQPQLTIYLQIFSLAIPGLSLYYTFASILRGMKLVRSSLYIERTIVYTVAILLGLVLGSFYDLVGIFVAFAIGCYIAAISGYLFIRKYLPKSRETVPFSIRRLLHTSLPLLIVMFSNQLVARFDIIIVGILLSANDTGIYGVALKVSLLLSMALSAVTAINGPKIAELYHTDKRKHLEAMVQKSSLLTLLIAAPLFAAMSVFPSYILSMFGNEFMAGALVLVILSIGQFVNAATGSVEQLLSLTDHERILAKAVSIITVVNIILLFILTSKFGIIGAAAAVALTLVAKNLLYIAIIKKVIGIWPVKFFRIGVAR